MRNIASMTQLELGAYVAGHLSRAGIRIVLSGGAAVSFYCKSEYVSKDLDFVNLNPGEMNKINSIMIEMGFIREGRHYRHPESVHIIEFPPGPLSVGDELISIIAIKKTKTGSLCVVSPTDCVKDRLAAYYHWGDRQCLQQAILVCRHQKIDLEEVQRWSEHEGKMDEFLKIKPQLLGMKLP